MAETSFLGTGWETEQEIERKRKRECDRNDSRREGTANIVLLYKYIFVNATVSISHYWIIDIKVLILSDKIRDSYQGAARKLFHNSLILYSSSEQTRGRKRNKKLMSFLDKG